MFEENSPPPPLLSPFLGQPTVLILSLPQLEESLTGSHSSPPHRQNGYSRVVGRGREGWALTFWFSLLPPAGSPQTLPSIILHPAPQTAQLDQTEGVCFPDREWLRQCPIVWKDSSWEGVYCQPVRREAGGGLTWFPVPGGWHSANIGGCYKNRLSEGETPTWEMSTSVGLWSKSNVEKSAQREAS